VTDWIELAILLAFSLLGLWVAFLLVCMALVALFDAWGRPKGWKRWGR